MAKQPGRRPADKAQRLADALRANLQRRKKQARRRAAKAPPNSPKPGKS